MGILNSSNDLLAKMKANDEKAQSDLFSMSEDSTLPPVFRNMAKRGFDYIVALEAEAEIHNDHIATLERQLQEARGRCRYRFADGCVKNGPCECGLRPDTSTAGE